MANHCCVCDVRRPPEPCFVVVLGDDWYEFGDCCADTPDFFQDAETGESLTPRQLFELLGEKRER